MKTLDQIIAERVTDFQAGRTQCAETVLCVMAEYYGWENPLIPRIASAFGGGMAATQGACGAFTGGSMVIGALMGREVGGDRDPAVAACKELHRFITTAYGAVDCKGIVGEVDFADPAQRAAFRAEDGKHAGVCEPLVAAVCRHLAARYPRPEGA